MSLEGVEKALYDLNLSRRTRESFGSSPEDFVARYVLTGEQRQLLVSRDVRGLIELGANPMLVWGFWMTCAENRSNAAYLAALRGHAGNGHQEGE